MPRCLQLFRWVAFVALVASLRGGAAPAPHWSFVAPQRWSLPRVTHVDWTKNAIDFFILEKLEPSQLTPSREADRVTLIRRASLDLIGLPPTPEEVDEFLRDRRPDAYERLVERLLASPHYGERWGRHWLDQARYADSNGYSIDAARNLWRWRAWVIDALNRDLPFDQFTIEQLAGDLLEETFGPPNATTEQRIATGFHRNTLINQEGGIDLEQFRVEAINDRVATTGTVWLGLTIACAQCHDHKFDPIKQREYYQLFAFFNNCDEPELELATPEQLKQRDALRRQIAALAKTLDAAKKNNAPEVTRLEAEFAQVKKSEQQFASTMVLRERAQPRETTVHIKGDFTRKGDRVEPGIPHVLDAQTGATAKRQRVNRLDLARWLIAADNPLTARVAVNRMWMRFFGKGLVETDEDFGTQGTPPSHPKLLDWLATEFVRQGWSMKAMHRLIVTSATYRQASKHRADIARVDAHNKLLARQSRVRLEAEIIRDSALAASGLLTRKLGGPSVFPPQPEGVYKLTQVDKQWKPSTGADRYRRGLYTFFWRSAPHPALVTFDAPDATQCCTRRNRSNTPLQALTLLNDEPFVELANQIAARVMREAPGDDASRLRRAFRLCLAREPTADELQRLRRVVSAEAEAKTAWTTLGRVLLNLDEFVTRE